MANLFTKAGESSVDNLIAGNKVFMKSVAGTLPASATGYTRGMPLTVSDAGAWTKAATQIHGILLDDVPISTDPTEVPIALTGEFNQNVMDLTSLGANANTAIIRARDKQIYIAPMNQAPFVQI